MTVTETGRLAGSGRPERVLSERWFNTRLDQPAAQRFMEYVLDRMFGVPLDPPRLTYPPRLTDPSGPFVSNRRRHSFGASLITGSSDLRGRAGEPAHIEVRLYPEHEGTTIYIGVAALCYRHPGRWEARMLDAFERSWRAVGDNGLYQVRPPAYEI